MPRVNPFTLRPSQTQPVTRVFIDDNAPGTEWTLTLQPPANYSVDFLIGDREEQVREKYVDGGGVLDPVGGERALMSKSLCHAIAMLSVLHRPDDGDAPYTVDEWAALSVTMPDAFIQAAAWAQELMTRKSEAMDLKND